jgi:hypothetical protein
MDQLKEVGWGILICPIEKWYYKKNNLILKPKFKYLRVGIWNLLTNMNKIYNPTPESWSAILETH